MKPLVISSPPVDPYAPPLAAAREYEQCREAQGTEGLWLARARYAPARRRREDACLQCWW